MPRYYFDTHDGEHGAKDDDGTDLHDLKAARLEAISLLPDIARDVFPDGDRRDIIVDVRDGTGMVVYTATLSLVGRWLG